MSPPIEDLPFGKFVWGTEAYPDKYGFWWVNDYVKNAADGPPLPVSWMKAGIDRSLLKPLQAGEPICRSHFIGALAKHPVPDRTPPFFITWIATPRP